jgi:hypothetical protein
VIPILLIYRKYYGGRYTVRITALMFVTMVIAALIVNGIFSALGLIPTGPRPTRADTFSSIQLNYKLALNVLGLVIFGALLWLTARRGATDPVCGMKVNRDKAVDDGRRSDLLLLLNPLPTHLRGPAPPRSARPRRPGRGCTCQLIECSGEL